MQELGAYDGRQAFGTAASPALHGDRVFVVHDNVTESFMAAYDKRGLGSEPSSDYSGPAAAGVALHLALRLALEARLTQRLGYRPQCPHHDDGGFIRLAPPEPTDDDVYISAAQVKRCELVSGDKVAGPMRPPRRCSG